MRRGLGFLAAGSARCSRWPAAGTGRRTLRPPQVLSSCEPFDAHAVCGWARVRPRRPGWTSCAVRSSAHRAGPEPAGGQAGRPRRAKAALTAVLTKAQSAFQSAVERLGKLPAAPNPEAGQGRVELLAG